MISTEVRQAIGQIAHSLDQTRFEALTARWRALAKEPAGMGAVESAALHFCMLRGREPAMLGRRALYVICAAQGLTAGDRADAPSAQERFNALIAGAAPASALARLTASETVVINAAVSGVPERGSVALQLAEASGDATNGPAMSWPLANEALEAGIVLAADAANRFDAVGLACLDGRTNAPASALASALLGPDSDAWVYCEPSLDHAQSARRLEMVRAALLRNRNDLAVPFGALRSVGSIDLAVMTGFVLGAALRRLPVILDGFAATVAAFMARRVAPDALDVCLFSHSNPSRAHAGMLELLAVTPILGSGISEEGGYGAVLALHHLDLALRVLQRLHAHTTIE